MSTLLLLFPFTDLGKLRQQYDHMAGNSKLQGRLHQSRTQGGLYLKLFWTEVSSLETNWRTLERSWHQAPPGRAGERTLVPSSVLQTRLGRGSNLIHSSGTSTTWPCDCPQKNKCFVIDDNHKVNIFNNGTNKKEKMYPLKSIKNDNFKGLFRGAR